MQNFSKEANKIDVQSHIDEGFKIIEQHLPMEYVDLVNKILNDPEVTDQSVRNVKLKRISAKNNLKVFNAIVEVALENKKDVEALQELITKK